MEKVFERKTQSGDKLECFIKHTDISVGYHQMPKVAAANPQKIQYTLLEDGCVAVAENEFFVYQWLNRNSGASPKVDGLDHSECREFNLLLIGMSYEK